MSKDRLTFGKIRFHGPFCDLCCPFLEETDNSCTFFDVRLSDAFLPYRRRCEECKNAI